MNISAAEFKARLADGDALKVLDVRNELEFHTFNVGGLNVPLGTLPGALEDLDLDTDEEIIVVCQHGIRSETARRILESAGFTHVRNLSGGILAYRKLI